MGHVTMENRHGLAVAAVVTKADGTAERGAAHAMLKAKRKAVGHRITAGADKAYDTKAMLKTRVPSTSRRMQPFIWVFVGLVCAICGYFLQAIGAQKIENEWRLSGKVFSIVGCLMFCGAPLLTIFGWLHWGWGLL